jgi:hypothetical protein
VCGRYARRSEKTAVEPNVEEEGDEDESLARKQSTSVTTSKAVAKKKAR